ncbi:MAG: hypothetical protein ACYTEU_13285 [Planctomycetota bacterium]|jgi:hypothetical protein
MKAKDEATMRGRLRLAVYKIIEGRKIRIDWFSDHNLITLSGKQLITFLLAGEPGNHKITKIAVGEDGTAPSESDTDLTNKFTKLVDSYNFLADNIVQFNLSIDTGEANGLNIAEFGLFSDDEQLFARKIRLPAIPKDSDIIIEGDWTIWIFECKLNDFAVYPNIVHITDSTIEGGTLS